MSYTFVKVLFNLVRQERKQVFFPTGTSDSRIVLCGIYYNIYFNKKSLKMSKG